MEFSVIVAVDEGCGIGKNGSIPWNDPSDRKFFREKTQEVTDEEKAEGKRNAVIMGRKTWDSLPKKPLPNRINIVVSNSLHGDFDDADFVIVRSFEQAVEYCGKAKNIAKVWVIGGTTIYSAAVKHQLCKYMYITRIQGKYDCDVIFPYSDVKDSFEFSHNEELSDGSKRVRVLIDKYKGNDEEKFYLTMVRALIGSNERLNRTSSTTRGVFGEGFKFSLLGGKLPLLTSRRLGFKTILHELLWFISGETTIDYLKKNNVHIWDGNTSREFLDSNGLSHFEVGEVGCSYPFHWRHFGAEYIPIKQRQPNHKFGGVDQLANVIRGIQVNPWGRRHLVSAWNPAQINQCALPSCHHCFQFYVSGSDDEPSTPKYLSIMVTMRSGDIFHGIPFNIASYSLLVHMVAKICRLEAKEISLVVGDLHLYSEHIEAARKLIERPTREFPTISFSEKINKMCNGLSAIDLFCNESPIDSFAADDIVLHGYYPQDTIKVPMVV